MPKKCIICGEMAKYCIRDCSDFYCEECAEENFADMSLLEKVDERCSRPATDEEASDEDPS